MKAVVFYGSPGSGKGMQANLLADTLGFVHIDTGRILRAILSDDSKENDPVIKKERDLNDAGILNTPSWVFDVLKTRVTAMAEMGYGIVFSGSPRTLYEADRLIPLLEELYGKKNVVVINLDVPFEEAARRNGNRLICTTCKRPLLTAYFPDAKVCPVCAGKLERRIDDDPEKFKTRTEEYEKRTLPILNFLKERGYEVTVIDGRPAPFEVFQKVYDAIKNSSGN